MLTTLAYLAFPGDRPAGLGSFPVDNSRFPFRAALEAFASPRREHHLTCQSKPVCIGIKAADAV